MNKDEALELFRKFDDPERWDYPLRFDYANAIARFKRFATALDDALGKKHDIMTGTCVQDASFHSQIDLHGGSLRFSNFGDMVAPTPNHDMDTAVVQLVRRLLCQHGYVYVPAEFTEEPYTGCNPGVTGIRDWWIRYFDWV